MITEDHADATATSTTRKIVVDEAIPLGKHRSDRLVLIRRHHDADR